VVDAIKITIMEVFVKKLGWAWQLFRITIWGYCIILVSGVLLQLYQGESNKEFDSIEPELLSYVVDFGISYVFVTEDLTKKELDKISKKLSSLTIGFYTGIGYDTTVGWCDHVTNEIGIESRNWLVSTSNERYQLMFHELAHCVLGRGHTDRGTGYPENLLFDLGFKTDLGKYEDKCPKSMMYPFVLSDYCIGKYSKSYLYELFNPGKEIPAQFID
jgi:hypothetical protein